jgi:hypothetical protein
MAESGSDPGDCLTGVGLPDVGHVPMKDFLRSEHPAIVEALRRVKLEAETGQQNYAAFGSAV